MSPSLYRLLDTIKAGAIALFSSSRISNSWDCAYLKESSRTGVYWVSTGQLCPGFLGDNGFQVDDRS